ncbi:unnamed protein product [Microthlaspi erraticum]|uniref:Uncharacterized protein n=1 Tax=Microthlaspi erraticum TaxID=1685480 RepID=A0A6D2I0P5_9BRAS|nr:unnamed protein product [Microthlaspi erraticum]
MTLEQKPAKGTSLTEALTVDRHASSAKFLRRLYRENSAQPRSPAGRETIVSRSAKVTSVRLKSRPKFETDQPIIQHDRSDSAHDPTVRPIVPTDRANAAVDPKPVLKPDFIFSRPGLTLSRPKRPSTIYVAF